MASIYTLKAQTEEVATIKQFITQVYEDSCFFHKKILLQNEGQTEIVYLSNKEPVILFLQAKNETASTDLRFIFQGANLVFVHSITTETISGKVREQQIFMNGDEIFFSEDSQEGINFHTNDAYLNFEDYLLKQKRKLLMDYHYFCMTNANKAENFIKETSFFHKKYIGVTFRNIPIIVNLTREENQIFGKITYPQTNKTLILKGVITETNIIMKEFDANGESIAAFSGTYTSPHTIEGTEILGSIENSSVFFLEEVLEDTAKIFTSLEEAIKEPEKVFHLYLSNRNLTKIPTEVFNLYNLMDLNLSNNAINILPEEINKLSSLKILNIENNKIHSFPQKINRLTQLTVIEAQNNLLTYIPTGFFELKKLKKINFSGNFLPENLLQKIKTLPIETIEIEGNKTTIHYNFTSAFQNPETVTVLELSNNNIEVLPPNIDLFINLLVLNILENPISNISEKICKLTQLQELNISNTNIQTIPLCISALPVLSAVNLSHNTNLLLKNIIRTLSGIKSLKEVNLSDCEIESLPVEIQQLTNIESLNLSNNSLKELNEEIGWLFSLKKLNLENNNLQNFPVNFNNISKLEEINIAGNKKLSDEILAEVLPKFQNLRTVILSGTISDYQLLQEKLSPEVEILFKE